MYNTAHNSRSVQLVRKQPVLRKDTAESEALVEHGHSARIRIAATEHQCVFVAPMQPTQTLPLTTGIRNFVTFWGSPF